MQNNAPKILAVVLLIIIAVLMLIAGSGSINKLFLKDDTPGNADTDNPDPSLNDEEEPDDTMPEDPVPSSVFPKSPLTSQIFMYEQLIALEGGAALKAVHRTAAGVYIIVENASSGGDFKNAVKAVSVVKMSLSGVLEAAYHIAGAEETSYFDSQLTDTGLAVAVARGEKTLAYTVSYDLSDAQFAEIKKAAGARIFPLDNGYLLLLKNENSEVCLMNGASVLKTAAVQSGDLIETVEFANYFMLVINGINGYNIVQLDKNLSGFSSYLIPQKTALKIQPVVESGLQKFIVAEKENGAVYLTKYDKNFRSSYERVCLGLADGADIYLNQATVFILLKGGSGRMYLADLSLNVIMTSASYLKNVTAIFGCECYTGGYLMLTSGEGNKLMFIDIRDDGTVSEKKASDNAGASLFLSINSATALLFFSEQDGIHIACVEL